MGLYGLTNGAPTEPLLPGRTGYSGRAARAPVGGSLSIKFRYLPSFMRLWARYDPEFPELSEAESIVACSRFSKSPGKLLHSTSACKKLSWLIQQRPYGGFGGFMRSNRWVARHPHGWKQICFSEIGMMAWPVEIAHMRLPDDLAYDEDVVFMQAAVQGITDRHYATLYSDERSGRVPMIHAGLQKFLKNPWVQYALIAPFMPEYGVDLGPAMFSTTVSRMSYLNRNPYDATERELDCILSSPSWQIALSNAQHMRRMASGNSRYRWALPCGLWYHQPLGIAGRKLSTSWIWVPSRKWQEEEEVGRQQ